MNNSDPKSSPMPAVDSAIHAARAAFEAWSMLSIDERAKRLLAFAEKLRQHHAAFTESICRETGKPRWEAKTETDSMIAKIAISIESQNARHAPTIQPTPGERASTVHKPHGVVAVLGPFNFPGHLPNGHIVPALLAGNTVVFKPSELTPQVGAHMVRLWTEAGLPAGVLNLAPADREAGKYLVAHPGIDGVFFTGSFDAGRAINRALADQPGKIVALEMGGNNPLIVHKVADTLAACLMTIQSAYLSAGQRCSCARRLILVDNSQSKQFIDQLIKMIPAIVVGHYTENPEPFMGPVINATSAERLLAAQQNLLSLGGKALVELRADKNDPALLSPGLIDVSDVANRPDEEYFGPLLQVIRVRSFEDAINEANRTRFGLSAGLLCDERGLWDIFRAKIRAGVVNWNRPLTGASSQLPFGGIGCSGNHRPSAYYASDYCSHPVAMMESDAVIMPDKLPPGLPNARA